MCFVQQQCVSCDCGCLCQLEHLFFVRTPVFFFSCRFLFSVVACCVLFLVLPSALCFVFVSCLCAAHVCVLFVSLCVVGVCVCVCLCLCFCRTDMLNLCGRM